MLFRIQDVPIVLQKKETSYGDECAFHQPAGGHYVLINFHGSGSVVVHPFLTYTDSQLTKSELKDLGEVFLSISKKHNDGDRIKPEEIYRELNLIKLLD